MMANLVKKLTGIEKKALLINPPTGKYMRDDRCQAPVESMTAQPGRAPMDLAYMAAMLEQLEVSCMIRDYPFERGSWQTLKQDLIIFRPDYLIISTTTPTIDFDMLACEITRQLVPSSVTIAKGAYIIENADEVLAKFTALDIAIWGDYNAAIREIILHDWAEVKGISFRQGEKIHRTAPPASAFPDLEKLPLPARHLLKNNLYRTPDTNKPLAYILTGRGCPHRCIYCAVSVASGYKVVNRPVANIIEELKECYYRFGIRDFFFQADTFTWNEEWVISLCREIVNSRLPIRWGTNSRVDTINESRIHWMKRAGCDIIGFGIESGSQEMLNSMKKKATREQARSAIALCSRYRIKTYLLFVFGLPWETKRSAQETIRFAKELGGDFADFNIAYPLPGTEFYEIACRDRLFEGSLSGFDYGKPLIKSYYLSTEELKSIRARAIREFYLRPKYILKTILGLRKISILLAYCRQGVSLLKKIFLPSRAQAQSPNKPLNGSRGR